MIPRRFSCICFAAGVLRMGSLSSRVAFCRHKQRILCSGNSVGLVGIVKARCNSPVPEEAFNWRLVELFALDLLRHQAIRSALSIVSPGIR